MAESEPKERPLNELLSRDMVDIYVGPENTHWILHEKLLCHRSTFFRSIFYDKKSLHRNHAFGLPDEDDKPFRLFVGWLYSAAVPPPKEEKDLADLFDLYLMAEKWAVKSLMVDVLDAVRRFYKHTDTYPGLRRVQYVYANTQEESPMRKLLVSAVARDLVLRHGMPDHWRKALSRNGQLAVDLILAVQSWDIEREQVLDPRDEPVAPGVQEALDKGGLEQELPDGEELPNGVVEVNRDSEDDDKTLTNGINGLHVDDDDGSDNDE